jgi:hypothetical protein
MSTFVTKTQVTQSGQVISLVTDSSPQAGDFLIATVTNLGGFDEVLASGATSGWQVLAGGEVEGSQVHILYKFLATGGAQSVSITFGAVSSFTRTLAVNVFRFISTSGTVNAEGTNDPQSVANQTLVTFAQPTTSADGCLIFRVLACLPTGSSVVFSISAGTLGGGYTDSSQGNIITSYADQTSAGAVPAATGSSTLTSDMKAYVFAFKPDLPPSDPSGISLNPSPIDTTGTLSFTRGTDPEGADVFTEVEFSTDNGANYFPFVTSAANANSVAVNFSGVAAGTQTKLRLKSRANGLYSAGVVFGPFTVQHAPSAPVWLSPSPGSSHVVGRNKTLDWSDSFDPDTPSNQITYDVERSTTSASAGFSAVSGSPTAAGVTQLVYNFAGLPAGNVWIRVRGKDGTNNGAYTTIQLVLVADVAPGAPSPVTFEQGGASISANFDRAAALKVGWTFSDPGDTQQDYQVEASLDGGSSWTIDSGIIASSAQSHTFAAGVFTGVAAGTVVTFRVRTRDGGNTWSTSYAQATITARIKPTVTITSPTAGGTVGEAKPVIAWTPSAQDTYELMILTSADAQEWTSGEVASAATTRQIEISLQNGTTHKAKLRVRKDGVWSDFVTHSFTVAYAAPAPPVLTATPSPDDGWISLSIDNPTPTGGQPATSHNEVWAYIVSEGAAFAWQIAPNVENDGTFLYRLAQHNIEMGFYAIAFSSDGEASQGLADTATLLNNPEDLWLMDVNDPEGMFAVIPEEIQESGALGGQTVYMDGSELPVDFFDGTYDHKLVYRVPAREGTPERANLMRLFKSRSTICVRDGWHKTFASWRSFQAAFSRAAADVTIPIQEVRFIEALHVPESSAPPVVPQIMSLLAVRAAAGTGNRLVRTASGTGRLKVRTT